MGNFYDPTNTASYNHVIPLAIDRRPGFPYLFAAFSGENKIVFFKVATNCQLVWVSSTLATSPAGASVLAIAVSRAWAHIVVVTYGDGYVQSFNIVGGTLTPNPVVLGTGLPQGVDITRNGRWAVFGDWQTGGTQVEVSPIALSGTLGPLVNNILVGGTDSRNVWLSPGTVGGNPNNFYLYVTNKASGQVSTFKINQVSGAITLLGPCPPGYTVTTTLFNPGTWIYPAGLHTTATGGAGTRLVVAEYGVPSSVSLLKINGPTGCMKELVSTGSPFPDPSSNNGLESIDVFPSRPY